MPEPCASDNASDIFRQLAEQITGEPGTWPTNTPSHGGGLHGPGFASAEEADAAWESAIHALQAWRRPGSAVNDA